MYNSDHLDSQTSLILKGKDDFLSCSFFISPWVGSMCSSFRSLYSYVCQFKHPHRSRPTGWLIYHDDAMLHEIKSCLFCQSSESVRSLFCILKTTLCLVKRLIYILSCYCLPYIIYLFNDFILYTLTNNDVVAAFPSYNTLSIISSQVLPDTLHQTGKRLLELQGVTGNTQVSHHRSTEIVYMCLLTFIQLLRLLCFYWCFCIFQIHFIFVV